MKNALVLSPGIGTPVLALLRLGFRVYANRIKPEYAHIYKKHFPSVTKPPIGKCVDLIVSFKEEITLHIIENYKPKWIVSLPDLAVAWKRRYHHSVFDLNCSHYNTPQARKQTFFVGTRLDHGKNESKTLAEFIKRISSQARNKPMTVRDALPEKQNYLLPPCNGRALFSADFPAPHLVHNHWPIVIDYKPGVLDIRANKKNARHLSIEEMATLQGIDYPLYNLNRKDAVKAITESVPTEALRSVFSSIL